MKSQFAGSLFGALIIAVSGSTFLSFAGLNVPYLPTQPAYALSSQTLAESETAQADAVDSKVNSVRMARRYRSISR